MVAAMAEHIIPRTETPGAIDAGTPVFIESMVADWFNEQERAFFMRELQALDDSADGFARLPEKQQLRLLENLESEAKDAPWYQLGNTMRVWDSQAPFICQFKELTVLGYMLSEIGSTQFLRHPVMGSFNGNLPLERGDAAFSSDLSMRTLTSQLGSSDDA